MEIQLTTKNLEMTPRLREYLEKKVSKLDRYISSVDEMRVDLAVENTRSDAHSQVAQFTMWIGGTVLRAEERAPDMFAAIDASVDKMRRQISRFKDRRRTRRRRPKEVMPEIEEVPEWEIVRVKQFDVIPMTPEEAVEQMELLGHQFFVFLNVDEGNLNVVYRRRDGNYGLIMPRVQ